MVNLAVNPYPLVFYLVYDPGHIVHVEMALRQHVQLGSSQNAMRVQHSSVCMVQPRRAVRVYAAKTESGPKIAVVGVTGAVGQEFLKVEWDDAVVG